MGGRNRQKHRFGSPGARFRSATEGFTLVEALVAIMILSLLAIAISDAGRTIFGLENDAQDTWEATQLGLALMDEIINLPFEDREEPENAIGVDTGEWKDPWIRASFDDVDDYNAWVSGFVLQNKDGAPIGKPGYTRTVTVNYSPVSNFSIVSMAPTDYKVITVNVYKYGDFVRSIKVVRARGGRSVDYNK